jgi:hypothetical protein
MHAFNRHRRKLARSAAWLVTEEQARLTVALVVRGLWRLVRVRNVGAGWREELPELLSREAELARCEEPVERVVLA